MEFPLPHFELCNWKMCVYMEPNLVFEPGPKVFWIWKKCTKVGAKGFQSKKSNSNQCWVCIKKEVRIGHGFKLIFTLNPLGIIKGDSLFETHLEVFSSWELSSWNPFTLQFFLDTMSRYKKLAMSGCHQLINCHLLQELLIVSRVFF